MDVDLAKALREGFGLQALRPGQEAVIRQVRAGEDTLALMPTGSGKSLCYQLPALLSPAPTLVLSPLIALMKDQIDHLPAAVRERATFINSSLEGDEAARRLQRVARGEVKLLYAAPERLRQASFVTALRRAGIGLVCVDEAHCIALWGHDFRTDYLFIRPVLPALGRPVVLCMTATATPEVADEIGLALDRRLRTVRLSVVRANLRYDVLACQNKAHKLEVVLGLARRLRGCGLVYVRSRSDAERVAEALRQAGCDADHYHAGRPAEERTAVQDAFLTGRVRVVAATTAFGMGVDKPDIRWIVLLQYPTSIEDFVQQVGRAGRDGRPSLCLLLASAGDAAQLRTFARRDVPTAQQLRQVYAALRRRASGDGAVEVEADALHAEAGLPERRDPRVLLAIMERCGLLHRGFDAGRAMRLELLPPPGDAAGRIEELLDRTERAALERAERVIGFAESDRCRHRQVAEHFGESCDTPCMRCDACDAEYSTDTGRWDAQPPTRRTRTQRTDLPEPRETAGDQADAPPRIAPPGAVGTLEDGARETERGLVERLRHWRGEQRSRHNVPAYVILQDRTLLAVAAARPRTIDELLALPGIGPAKAERYGVELLALVRESLQEERGSAGA